MSIIKTVCCTIVVLTVLVGCSDTTEDATGSSDEQVAVPTIKEQQVSDIDVPEGVSYTFASEEVNQQALEILEGIVADVLPVADLTSHSSQVIICGPGLWRQLKGLELDVLNNARDITFMVPLLGSDEINNYEGKRFFTDEEKDVFWEYLLAYIHVFRTVPEHQPISPIHVRKANAEELQYYWSIIPYDSIREPFYIIAIDEVSLLFDFIVQDGHAEVFTVDIVLHAQEE